MKAIQRADLLAVVEALGFEPSDVLYAHISPNEIRVCLYERDADGMKIYNRDSDGTVVSARCRVEVRHVVN